MDLKFIFLRLWVPEHMQLLLFCQILKTLGTSAKNAAKTIIFKAENSYGTNQYKC